MTSNSQDISTISHINTMSTIHALLTINTATDPNITILVAGCTISREIETLVGTEIGVEITVVVVVDSTSHGWPWLSNGKNASNIISFEFLASGRVQNDGLDTKEGECCGTRLSSNGTRKRGDNDGTSLCLPVGVDDSAVVLTDLLIVPFPSFRVNGFTNRANDSQCGKIIAFQPLVTQAAQRTDSGGSSIELGDLVLLDNLPETGWSGISRGRFKQYSGCTESQGAINNIGMASDPSNVGHTSKDIIGMIVKDVLNGSTSSKKVTASSVHNTLGSTGRSRCVKQEKRVFSVHWFRGAIRSCLGHLIMPPQVTAIGPGNVSASTTEDKDTFNRWGGQEGLIYNTLGSNSLTTALAFVSSKNNLGASIDNTVAKRIR